MSLLIGILIVFAGVLVAVYWLSHVIEALRQAPPLPDELPWLPGVPIRYLDVDGIQLRHVTTGDGPPLVLLHTLRTQLDLFEQVIPELARTFTVHAVDLPGHGFSDIPDTDYTPAFFTATVRGFLDRLAIENAVIAGSSIGGTMALVLAAEGHPAVGRVVAVNPYDYDRGHGIMRGSWLARLVFTLSTLPLLGGVIWRLRGFGIFRLVLKGSVHRATSLPPELLRLMHEVGNRRGHYRAFLSLIEHFPDWEEQRAVYPAIRCPVLLIYGRHDWSREAEREADHNAIPGARRETVDHAGHLLSLDAPRELVGLIRRFGREA